MTASRGRASTIILFATVLFLNGRTHATKPDPIPTVSIQGHPYVVLQDLARSLEAEVRIPPLKDKVILKLVGGQDLVFIAYSSVYTNGQVQHRLPYRVIPHNGRLHVSTEIFRQLGHLANVAEARTEVPTQAPAVVPPAAIQAESGADVEARWAIDKIVIDPGHGGKDPGAVGPKRTFEKDITLQIAKRLGERLKKELKVEVVFTRQTDVFIGLGARARKARDVEGDLFVSLHCNAGTRRGASGYEVYFLSEAKTEAAAEVAERENAALEFETEVEVDEDQSPLRSIALGILSAQFLKESQDLAASIRGQMKQRFKTMDDRGVKQANFYVMRGTMGSMPSVLVEMGFISNPQEEKRLKTRSFQKNMANAIFEGIRQFKRNHERQFSNTN